MSENINIQKAERNALGLHFKDGLWEILLGSFFVVLAFEDILETKGWSVLASYTPAFIVFGVGMVFYFLAKRFIVTPRIGMVEMRLGNSPQRLRMLIAAVVLQMITLVVFILAMNGKLPGWVIASPEWTVDAIFGIMVFMFFTLMAYTIQANRFIIHGFLMGAAMPIRVIWDLKEREVNTYPSMIAGAVMVLIGIYVFYRFMKEYPIAKEE